VFVLLLAAIWALCLGLGVGTVRGKISKLIGREEQGISKHLLIYYQLQNVHISTES